MSSRLSSSGMVIAAVDPEHVMLLLGLAVVLFLSLEHFSPRLRKVGVFLAWCLSPIALGTSATFEWLWRTLTNTPVGDPRRLLERAARTLGSARVVDLPGRRLEVEATLDGREVARIELGSRAPQAWHDVQLTAALRNNLPRATLRSRAFHLLPADAAPWPAGVASAPELDGEARLALDELFGRFGLDAIEIEGDRLVARRQAWPVDHADEWPRALELLGRVARALGPAAPPLAVHVEQKAGELRCAFCHEDLAAGADIWRCERCSTVLHAGCREELGRCSALGCGRAPGRTAVQ